MRSHSRGGSVLFQFSYTAYVLHFLLHGGWPRWCELLHPCGPLWFLGRVHWCTTINLFSVLSRIRVMQRSLGTEPPKYVQVVAKFLVDLALENVKRSVHVS